jgi:hypothetical protein
LEVLKQDTRGRVRVSQQRREALLDEFEKSGASGMKFARLAGLKYSTFANWVKERRERQAAAKPVARETPVADGAAVSAGPVRLFEALVEGGSRALAPAGAAAGLVVELPGGSRLRIESPVHLELAAELVALIAQRARGRC